MKQCDYTDAQIIPCLNSPVFLINKYKHDVPKIHCASHAVRLISTAPLIAVLLL